MLRVSSQRLIRHAWMAALLLSLALMSCWKVDADLVVSATDLNFGRTTESIVVTVRNDSEDNALTSGVTELDYTLKSDKSWVKVSPTSGRCGAMEKQAHTVSVDRALMVYGVNTATISVTSNGGSATIHVLATRPVPGCNDAPEVPHTPSPALAATGVATSTDLTWDGGDSQCDSITATYDVYFGTTSPPPFDHNNGTAKTWSPGALANNTLYFWRIEAKDANGITSGPEWRFRTVCNLGPSDVTLLLPANGATNVSVIDDLSWRGGDSRCAGLTATYDVYFGTTSPPPFHHNTLIKYWDAGVLAKGTTYFWRVVAKDANGTVTSEERSFTTSQAACTTRPSAVALVSPANNATNVPVTEDLVWSGGDSQCPGLTATYDVYFGTVTPPPFHHDNGAVKSWDATLDYNTVYYWRIVAKDANGSTSSSERTFRTPCNLPPTTPTLISPTDGATNVGVDANLTWNNGNSQCAGLTSTYDIYFGTTSPAPFVQNLGNAKAWDPGTMLPLTKYYWRVVAKDANGSVTSVERSFTTALVACTAGPGAVSLQSPADGATGVSLDVDISWTGGNSQCSGQLATYDVYFGTTTPPPFHHNNSTQKTWDPGTLAASEQYYWRIVAKDGNGTSSSSERDFTTGAAPCTLAPGAVTIVSPANGATGVSADANLSWGGGNSQCAGLTATYDVYFGTTNPPPLDHNNGTSKTWDPGTLADGTTYYWKIVAKDANGNTSGAVWSFVTAACEALPTAVSSPSPGDNATGVPASQLLGWQGGNSQCAGLTATYDVYFGTTSPPPFDHNNGTSKSWNPGTLSFQTEYFWRIVAKDANGNTSGAEWSFVVQADPCALPPTVATITSPGNNSTNVSINANLVWSGGVSQCPGLTATYDVYFGTTNPPPFDHNNGTAKSYEPGTLEYTTTYYWRIVSKDAKGETAGPVWSFTTEEPCLSAPTAPCTPNPSNGRTNVNENTNLAWSCGDSQCGLPVTYDVYFGTTEALGEAQKLGSTAAKTWDLPKQAKQTKYYWKVVARDANGTTSSAVWNFTTRN